MYRSFLSWRYLTSRRTNLIGIGGIFVAVTALILILSIMTGFLNEARASIRGSLSDLLIQPIQLQRDNRDGRIVPDAPERILEVIRADSRVEGAAAHLSWGGILTQEGSQSDRAEAFMASSQMSDLPLVNIVGIDVIDEMATTDFRESLTREPTLDKSGFPRGKRVENPDSPFDLPPEFRGRTAKKPPVVLIGEQLFYRLGLRRGESVQVTTIVPSAMVDGSSAPPPNMSFVVGGTFRSGENDMDLDRVYVKRDSLQDLIGDAREFSEILVRLEDYDRDGQAVRDDLRRPAPQLGADGSRPWIHQRSQDLGRVPRVPAWRHPQRAHADGDYVEPRARRRRLLHLCDSVDDGHGEAPGHRHPYGHRRDAPRHPDHIPDGRVLGRANRHGARRNRRYLGRL